MGILVACRCGQEFEAAAEHAGRRVSCPVCRQPLVIPRRFEVELEPASAPAPAAETAAPIEPAPSWGEPLTNVAVYSGNAIASLALGLLSMVCLAMTGVPAVLFGWLGLRDVKAGRGRVRGVGLSLFGMMFGLIGTILTGFVVYPFVNSWREAVTDQQCAKRLKGIGLAMHAYHGQFGRFPRAAIVDKQRRPLLSWRVAILPFMGPEGDALYRRFHLDEPWNSPSNLPLAQSTPWFYVCPSHRGQLAGTTTYQVAVGRETMFTGGKGITLAEAVDGPWNTILVTEAAQPVPWSAPTDLTFHPTSGVTGLSHDHPDGVNALYADGSVRIMNMYPGSVPVAPFTRDDVTAAQQAGGR